MKKVNSIDPLLARWDFEATQEVASTVFPDGCRDLILKISTDGRPCWFVTDLVETAYTVSSTPGERYVGYRLRPAAQVDVPLLLEGARRRGGVDHAEIPALLSEHVYIDPRLDEALMALSSTNRVRDAAIGLGVSQRTLERLIHSLTRRPPAYWRGLARARRAGRAVATCHSVSFAEVASDHGYSDQSHMTRDFKQWFLMTPRTLRRQTDLLGLLSESGYD